MGLDQYAYASKRGVKKVEIAYWRKHQALENWMAEKWGEAENSDDVFNCKVLHIDYELLDELEEIVQSSRLSDHGYFSNDGRDCDDYRSTDLEFCYKAKSYLDSGYKVYYTSWW